MAVGYLEAGPLIPYRYCISVGVDNFFFTILELSISCAIVLESMIVLDRGKP